MAVYMIFKYSKRFRYAPSFNNDISVLCDGSLQSRELGQSPMNADRFDDQPFLLKKFIWISYTVKLGDKERFDREHLALRNNFRVTKKFLIAKFDCTRALSIPFCLLSRSNQLCKPCLFSPQIIPLLMDFVVVYWSWFFLLWFSAWSIELSKVYILG